VTREEAKSIGVAVLVITTSTLPFFDAVIYQNLLMIIPGIILTILGIVIGILGYAESRK